MFISERSQESVAVKAVFSDDDYLVSYLTI